MEPRLCGRLWKTCSEAETNLETNGMNRKKKKKEWKKRPVKEKINEIEYATEDGKGAGEVEWEDRYSLLEDADVNGAEVTDRLEGKKEQGVDKQR